MEGAAVPAGRTRTRARDDRDPGGTFGPLPGGTSTATANTPTDHHRPQPATGVQECRNAG